MSLIIAHDLGTTGNKASLYSPDGKLLAAAFKGYDTAFPEPGWAEQNPADWWEAVCVTTRELLAKARVQPREVACITFSAQMMGCLIVDRQGHPLRNSIIWADTRALEQAQSLIDRVGAEEVYQITGHRASASYSLAKLLWIRDNQPDLYVRAHKVLHAKDYIVARLTGAFATDYSDASGMNLLDLTTLNWSDPILSAMQIDPSLLPDLHGSTDVVGGITPAAAAETGLLPGTPVVIGGGDGSCAAAGAGVVRVGSAYNYVGSSSWIGIATERPIFDPAQRTFTWVHVVPGLFSPTGTMQAAGYSYQWTREQLGAPEAALAAQEGGSAYEYMNRLAESVPPGADNLLYLPYLLGERSPRWNPLARGAFVGLSVKHTRAHMVRAVLEGVTFNLRVILDAFLEQGIDIGAIRVIGGGAKGALWRQIMADIYEHPIHKLVMLDEATSLGAAVTGGVGVGLFKDFSVAETWAVEEERLPNPETQVVYRKLYGVFNRAYAALEPIYGELAAR